MMREMETDIIMNRTDKIYVAGHRGLVGSAIVRSLQAKGYENIIGRTHRELDLTSQQAVREFFEKERPDAVVLAAAKVGGINANNTTPAEFAYENMQIQCNVIQCCHEYHVKKLLFLGSTCIYPRMAPQPIPEDALLTGPLEETNEAYAIAKIAGLEMCKYYKRQYGDDFISCMPTNLYGPHDNYDLEGSHVMPAMIRKFHEAKSERRTYGYAVGNGNAAPGVFICGRYGGRLCVSVRELQRRAACQYRYRKRSYDQGTGGDGKERSGLPGTDCLGSDNAGRHAQKTYGCDETARTRLAA